jgi:hypothetical protein
MDCFVVEPVIGLAEGETRWRLAMTNLKFTGWVEPFAKPIILANYN